MFHQKKNRFDFTRLGKSETIPNKLDVQLWNRISYPNQEIICGNHAPDNSSLKEAVRINEEAQRDDDTEGIV